MVEVLLGFCKKKNRKNKIALRPFFFLFAEGQEFFLSHLCCMQFWSSNKRLQEFFFQITNPPPPGSLFPLFFSEPMTLTKFK